MLLRWGLIYVLAVLALILGGALSWQYQVMSAASERHRLALEKFEALELETKAARDQAQAATREAIDLNKQIEREQREAEANETQRTKANEALAAALAAATTAQTAQASAEARLDEALKTQAAGEAALQISRNEADRLRRESEAASLEAKTARAKLAQLQSQVTRETGSIMPRTAPGAVPKTIEPTAVPAGNTAVPAPTGAIPTAPAPSAASVAETKSAAVPATAAATKADAGPAVSEQKSSKAKTPAKTAAKPRARQKPASSDYSFF